MRRGMSKLSLPRGKALSNIDSHPEITPEQVETLKIIAEMAEEIATAKFSYRIQGKTRLGLDRVEELIKLSAEIVNLMSQKIKDGNETRFVVCSRCYISLA